MPEPKEIKPFNGKPEWFGKTLKTAGLQFLLAFADDQVVLGWLDADKFVPSAAIDPQTLQRAHLFGKAGELRLLKKDTGFETVWLDDHNWAVEDMQDERYPLWRDGQQGLSFTVPEQFNAIEVRQYIRYDDQGQAYFSHSRLVAFSGGAK